MKTKSPRHFDKGFTLIEMLVTVTIIVILAGLSLGGFNFVTTKQANEKAKIQISLLSNALEEYKLDNGEYPASTGGTNALFTALYYNGAQTPPVADSKIYLADLDPVNNGQGWMEGSGATATIVDPWGEPYIYRNPPTVNPDFDLVSKGKDGELDTSDDITNY